MISNENQICMKILFLNLDNFLCVRIFPQVTFHFNNSITYLVTA